MAKLKDYGEGRYGFKCPGCGHEHVYYVNSEYWTRTTGKEGWKWNGSFDTPTFTPSLLNRSGFNADPNWKPPSDDPKYRTHPYTSICHLFITEGQIQYCGDSTHELSGKTVNMIDYENE